MLWIFAPKKDQIFSVGFQHGISNRKVTIFAPKGLILSNCKNCCNIILNIKKKLLGKPKIAFFPIFSSSLGEESSWVPPPPKIGFSWEEEMPFVLKLGYLTNARDSIFIKLIHPQSQVHENLPWKSHLSEAEFFF